MDRIYLPITIEYAKFIFKSLTVDNVDIPRNLFSPVLSFYFLDDGKWTLSNNKLPPLWGDGFPEALAVIGESI